MSVPYDDNRQPEAGCQSCSVLDDEMPDACEGCRHERPKDIDPEYEAAVADGAVFLSD